MSTDTRCNSILLVTMFLAVSSGLASGQSNGDLKSANWSATRTFRFPVRISEQPDNSQLADLKVEWGDVDIDVFGNFITLTGALKRRVQDEAESGAVKWEPIAWRQGISVLLEKSTIDDAKNTDAGQTDKEPRNKGKSSRGVSPSKELTYIENELTEPDGRFTARFYLQEISRDSSRPQRHRVAVSIADHLSDYRIQFSSDDKILEESISFITIPANKPIDPILISIHQACKREFNPTALIQAVNSLQKLGKNDALRKLEKYLEILNLREHYGLSDCDGLFWIIRILFEPIEFNRRIPVPMIYTHSVTDKAQADWALNPIVVLDDIPFRYIGGGIGGTGMPEHPLSHIEFARRYCVIRDAPLAPKHDPIATAQMLIDSQIVQQMAPEARKICIDDIKTQATLMIPEQRRKEGSSNKNVRWIEHWEQSQDRPLKWDEVRGFVESQQTPN